MKPSYTSLASAWVPCFLGASALAVVSACGGATAANAPAPREPAPAPPATEVEAPEVAAECDLETYLATLQAADLAWEEFWAEAPEPFEGFTVSDPGDLMEIADAAQQAHIHLQELYEIRGACGLEVDPSRAPALFVDRFSALIDRSVEDVDWGADRRSELERGVATILSDTRDAFTDARRARDEVAARAPGTECRRVSMLSAADWAAIVRRQEANYAEDERTMMDRNTWDDEQMDAQNQSVIDTHAIAQTVDSDPTEALRLLRASTSLRAWSTHAELVASLEALVQLCAEELSDEAASE